MRAADARLKLSIMINNSIRFSLTGGQVGWTTKMSRPRTSSSMRTAFSPSGKLPRLILPRLSPRQWAIFSASGTLARPEKILSLWLFIMEGRAAVAARRSEWALEIMEEAGGGVNLQVGRRALVS